MKFRGRTWVLVLVMLFALGTAALAAEKGFLWDGTQWKDMTNDIKVAYVKGIGNMAALNDGDPKAVALMRELKFDRLAALPYAALPIGTAISLQSGWPMIYPRKETKTYGTKAIIEGEYHNGEIAVLIDDLATDGGSKFEAIEKLTSGGLQVKDVVVLIDREAGAKEALAEAGFYLHAVMTITEVLDHWWMTNKIGKDKITEIRKSLSDK